MSAQNVIRQWEAGLKAAAHRIKPANLYLIPLTDDSVINFGNGTLDYDVKMFGSSASDFALWDASAKTLSLGGAAILDVPAGQLKIGSTAVLATAAELNRATDVSTRSIAAGATLSLTEAAHDGKTILLDTAAGSVVTLPAPVIGMRVRFLVTVKPTSNFHQIKVASASDFIRGSIHIVDSDANAATAYVGEATDDNIQLEGLTKGGNVGDWIELEGISATQWACRGLVVCTAGSNVADMFSAAV